MDCPRARAELPAWAEGYISAVKILAQGQSMNILYAQR